MYQVVFCNCPDTKTAQQIATTLVEQNLVACVNILPAVTSVYMWENSLQCEPEVMLMCKTKAQQFDAIKAQIENIHPYDVPEVIALDITQGNNAYLNWLNSVVK